MMDITDMMAAMPSPGRLLFRTVRVLAVLVVMMVLWRETKLESFLTSMIKGQAQSFIDQIEKSNITFMKDSKVVMKKNIRASLKSEVYFNILEPAIILAMFPLWPPFRPLLVAILATAAMIGFDILHTVLLGYLHYYKIVDITQGSAYLLGSSYFIAPIAVTALAFIAIDNGTVRWRWLLSQIKARKRKPVVPVVGRNAPCPCGSGLKYKKCCGK